MTDNIFNTLLTSQNPSVIFTALLADIVSFLPRLILATIVFLLGKLIASHTSDAVTKIINALDVKKIVESFQLGITLPPSSQKSLSQLLSLLVRYLILYFTLILTFDLLGLSGVAQFFRSIVAILPRLLSASFILLLGVIAAGIVESLMKKALLEIDPATARLSGKIASYVVIGFFILMSLAELGLASFFINSLFIGFVASISLALGLSLGLGSKDLVSFTLQNWYKNKSKKK